MLVFVRITGTPASAQLMTKPQVANLIKNVENGVVEFRNYLEKRGDNASEAASAANTPIEVGVAADAQSNASDVERSLGSFRSAL
jgi:hypothetical protein